jgi:hypothetical protein
MRCRGPWPGHGSLIGESLAPALRACAGRAQRFRAAIIRLLAPICAARAKARAAKRVQRPDQSDSRLLESEHAMLKINIPQHSRGPMIDAERAGFLLKAHRFQSDRVEASHCPGLPGTPVPKLKPSALQSLKNVSFGAQMLTGSSTASIHPPRKMPKSITANMHTAARAQPETAAAQRAPAATTSQGGTFQKTSSRKAAIPMAKSFGPRIALVQTGV